MHFDPDYNLHTAKHIIHPGDSEGHGEGTWNDTGTSHDKSATRNTETEIYWWTNPFFPHMFHIYCDLDSTHSDYTVCLM